MNKITEVQKVLLGILSAGLFGISTLDLQNAAWASIFEEAERQTVFPIVFATVEKEAEKGLPPAQFQAYMNRFFRYSAEAAKNDYYHGEMHSLLSSHGIPYVIMKGQASAEYYPRPNLRTMGDVDLLVSAGDLKRTRDILEENGFRRSPETDYETQMELFRDDEVVDIHDEPNGIPEGEKGDICRNYLTDCIAKAQLSSAEDPYFLPDAFHHGLILLLHTAQHLVNTGIGLRHLCDWAVFVAHFEEDVFQELFQGKLSKVGLWRFAQLLTAVSVRYLGLPEPTWAKEGADPDFLEAMMSDILDGGNFGRKDPERINDAKLISANGRMKGNMSLQFAASLSRKAKAAMPVCGRLPVLLPIGWVYVVMRHLGRVKKGGRPKIHIRQMMRGASLRREIYKEFKLFE